MNVAVVGSYPKREDSAKSTTDERAAPKARADEQSTDGTQRATQTPPRTWEEFSQVCRLIGEVLAKSGHRLIVPHADGVDTAESEALKEFRKTAPSHFYPCIVRPADPVLKAHLDAVEMSDAVILIGGKNGTYAAGLGALRRRKLIVPIPAFGGSAKDLCEIPEIDRGVEEKIRNLDLDDPQWPQQLSGALSAVLNEFPRVLIIHGRGDTGEALQERVWQESQDPNSDLGGIAKPMIMDLSGLGALSVPGVFEDLASRVAGAIAIITADDVGGFARKDMGTETYSAAELRLRPRARENLWVEVGWFWGRLGRERVFLWLKEELKLPTDLQGAAWTRGATVKEAWKSIKAFLSQLRNPEPTEARKQDERRPADSPPPTLGPSSAASDLLDS